MCARIRCDYYGYIIPVKIMFYLCKSLFNKRIKSPKESFLSDFLLDENLSEK